jgi:hypothetical protein
VASELDFRHVWAPEGGGIKHLPASKCEIKRMPIGNFNRNPVATFFGEKPLSG